ncbi:efflux RND transporter permease subunit [Aestuariibacter salexigens]|uniref:efflux RND transporter permease subunit n=1 Tax=Aestuariibacter salexigens TaxID=226010 RepID=UPI000411D11E|nr:MMPL family transporter [Aestuariibacter salexigens]
MTNKHTWLYTVLKHPWATIIAALVVLLTLTAGAQHLYFRGDYKVFFEPENPQRLAYEEMQNIFSKNDNVNIVIAPEDGNVFTPETLTLIKQLTDEAWQTPLSTRVNSVANYQHTYAEDDDLIVEDLLYSVRSVNQQKSDDIRAVALSEASLVHRLVSEKGDVAVINITVQLPDGDQTAEVFEIKAFVDELVAKFQNQYPNHEFYLTGIVALNNAFAIAAQQDAETLIPVMFLVIILIMWLLLKSITGTFATLLIVALSIAATMGLAGWSGLFLSTATVNVPTMVMTLAVADCIHVIASMQYAMRGGKSKEDAIAHSVQLNLMPIIITSVTTSIGFLTLNFSAVPVLADLGNLAAFGVMVACGLSFTLLPAMLKVMPIRVSMQSSESSDKLNKLAEWVIHHHRRILPYSAILLVIALSLAFTNKLNDIAVEYFDESNPFRQAADFQTDRLSGMSNIDFAIYTGEPSGLNAPQVLRTIEQFAGWLRKQPEVDHVDTITDTFKRLNKNLHSDDEAYYQLPDNQEMAAQYLLLYEMSLPYGLDLNNQIDIDKSATRLMVTMQNLGSKEFTAFEARAKAWFEAVAPELRITAASPPLMFAHIGEANMQSMVKGTLLALVLISALLVFALRSWRMGAVSLIPNLLPAGLGFGIWALISGQINMALSVVLTMTLGIIVDDSVHFLSKYRYAKAQGQSTEDSIRYAFMSVGRALVITTLVLASGFAILTLSSFALNSDMGLLTSIIIVLALLVDFIFLPAFLMIIDKPSSGKGEQHVDRQPISAD